MFKFIQIILITILTFSAQAQEACVNLFSSHEDEIKFNFDREQYLDFKKIAPPHLATPELYKLITAVQISKFDLKEPNTMAALSRPQELEILDSQLKYRISAKIEESFDSSRKRKPSDAS